MIPRGLGAAAEENVIAAVRGLKRRPNNSMEALNFEGCKYFFCNYHFPGLSGSLGVFESCGGHKCLQQLSLCPGLRGFIDLIVL